MAPATYQLSDLTSFIRRVFALNLPEPVWVAAELAQVNISRGHCWLTLVQKEAESDAIKAQLEAVVWANKLRELQGIHGLKMTKGLLQQGMSVRLRVSTSFHERFGLRLVVEDIDPTHTIGALERRRQQTLESLAADNLMNRNAELPLPVVPQRLAVISSDTAAGLADFREQLEGNPYGYRFQLRLFGAAMQGAQTSPEIISRLREIRRNWPDAFDAVVIVRGGGGRTDLAAFDDEALCRAVAEFPLPVLLGIGHETDETVLDRVAHKSLKTPTATAVFLVERLMQAEVRLLQLGRGVLSVGTHQLSAATQELNRQASAVRQAAGQSLLHEHHRLDRLAGELNQLPGRILSTANDQLSHYEQLLAALRPETTLARGYALVSQEGRLITNPDDLVEGEVDVRLKEGRVKLKMQGRGLPPPTE
ncbi:exodeoxyribonuclease VII large subunit [Neolewinella persica]|uniref:exodeoxyribonuclease VII large subunit n=1 Tax=Neolewinella persica TaxID=70998 RepID=UPI000382F10F|nr:exodeoxyribonuclease VII large subunit [Neolewinella persica]